MRTFTRTQKTLDNLSLNINIRIRIPKYYEVSILLWSITMDRYWGIIWTYKRVWDAMLTSYAYSSMDIPRIERYHRTPRKNRISYKRQPQKIMIFLTYDAKSKVPPPPTYPKRKKRRSKNAEQHRGYAICEHGLEWHQQVCLERQ